MNDGDKMDWEPSNAVRIFKLSGPEATQLAKDNAKLKGKRARWVDEEEIQARRDKNQYIRCGHTYYRKDICPLKAAVPPGGFKSRVTTTKSVTKASVKDDEGEESEGTLTSESEK